MIITSVYTESNGSAITSLQVKNGLVKPYQIWQSTLEDRNVYEVAAALAWRTEIYVVNPGANPASNSVIATLLKESGYSVKVSPSFNFDEGLAVYKLLNHGCRLDTGSAPFWPMFSEQIEIANSSPLIMAFFQGCIEARKRLRKRDVIAGAAVKSAHAVQYRPDGHYIPVSKWGTGRF